MAGDTVTPMRAVMKSGTIPSSLGSMRASKVGDDNLSDLMAAEGYLYFPRILARNQVASVRDSVIQLLAREGWIDEKQTQPIPIHPVHRIGSPSFFRCIEAIMRMEELHVLASAKPLPELVSGLLGEVAFLHPQKMVRISYPWALNPKDAIPPHQDLFYVKGERDTLTVWLPLGDYPRGMGGLRLLPRTHHLGLLPTQANDEGRFNCATASLSDENRDWLSADFTMGDVVIFHALTVHAAAPNHGDAFRLSLDCRYSSQRGRINAFQLQPPYYPHLKGWPDIVQGWTHPGQLNLESAPALDEATLSPSVAASRPSRFAR